MLADGEAPKLREALEDGVTEGEAPKLSVAVMDAVAPVLNVDVVEGDAP